MLKYKNEAILVIFSIFFTLLIVEIFFHFLPGYSGPISLPDSELGYIFRKNITKQMVNPESHELMTIQTNSYGFPDKEWNINSTSSKIFVIGDSFVAGFETQTQNRFTNLLQEKLGSEYEVENFGVPGSGPEAYILRLKKYFNEIKPEKVIFVIYNGNDFENANYDLTPNTGRINYKVINEKVVRYSSIASTKEKIKWQLKTFFGKLLLVQFLNDVFLKTKTSNLADNQTIDNTPSYCKLSKQNLENSKMIVNNIITQAKEIAGDRLIVLDIPEKNQLHFIKTDDCNNSELENSLEKFTKEQNIKYISALPDFKKATTSPYFVEHLNENGHQIISNVLYKTLIKK